MVSKTEEDNLKVVPDEIINNNDFQPNLHTSEQILNGKARVTPFRDKTYQKTLQENHLYHPQLHENRMSYFKLKFIHALE